MQAKWLVLWLFSLPTLVHLLGLLLLVAAAYRAGRTRSVGKFSLNAGLIFLAVVIPVAFGASSWREAAFLILWVLSIAVVYVFVLGMLVAKGIRLRAMIAISLPLFVLQSVVSLFSGVILGCYAGLDCI